MRRVTDGLYDEMWNVDFLVGCSINIGAGGNFWEEQLRGASLAEWLRRQTQDESPRKHSAPRLWAWVRIP